MYVVVMYVPEGKGHLVQKDPPMERITTDILGPLPETDKGNRYILVISD